MKEHIIYNVRARITRLLAFCLLILLPMTLSAQTAEERYLAIYDAAEQDYNIGRLEEARKQLEDNIGSFPVTLRQSGFRMLSLCYLAMDREDDAQKCVRLMLDENPYYSPTINDPQRFIDMVESLKSGRTAIITTASSQTEKLDEVPVPTTLITEEMIRNSCARNLQEVLAAYVPGMNIVDCNDDINIAMRGIYSNGQEKILIMLNGHRLNNFATNIASPDFSISLDKVHQIEVLRGPASSLYGGVSLTAVVNVITRSGAEVDGVEAHVGAGSHGQIKAGLLFGKRYFDLDVLVWGNLYKAKGEKVFVPSSETGLMIGEGDATIGRIGPKPSYDFGLQMKYKNLQFLYNTQFSQVISPFTMTYTFSPYNPDLYRTFDGTGPSFTTLSHHADLSYQLTVSPRFSTNFAVTFDNSDLAHYQVITDPTISAAIEVLPLPYTVTDLLKGSGGIYRYLSAQEHTIGGKMQGDWVYIDNGTHRGLLTFGAEYSYFQTDDARYLLGKNFKTNLSENDTISEAGKGHESNLNGFVQFKHNWNSFILNAGLRFDYKNRYDDSKIREFSPRLALIYLQPKWNLRLSYSKSFIDAPFIYRKQNYILYAYMGQVSYEDELSPESLHSAQLTFGAKQWLPGLNFEINGFYNHARNLIYYILANHGNTGVCENYGIELSASYERRRFTANLSTTWQTSGRIEMFDLNLDRSLNTPNISSDLVLAWQATDWLKLRTHIDFKGKQQTFYISLQNYAAAMNLFSEFQNSLNKLEAYRQLPDHDPVVLAAMQKDVDLISNAIRVISENVNVFQDIPSRVLFDVGATWRWRNLTLDLDVKNVFNHHYKLGGMSTGLVPQRGRWFMATVSYKF